MLIPSNYEINIARSIPRGAVVETRHWGRIELGHTSSESTAREALIECRTRFPEKEGWKLDLRKVTCYAEDVPC